MHTEVIFNSSNMNIRVVTTDQSGRIVQYKTVTSTSEALAILESLGDSGEDIITR